MNTWLCIAWVLWVAALVWARRYQRKKPRQQVSPAQRSLEMERACGLVFHEYSANLHWLWEGYWEWLQVEGTWYVRPEGCADNHWVRPDIEHEEAVAALAGDRGYRTSYLEYANGPIMEAYQPKPNKAKYKAPPRLCGVCNQLWSAVGLHCVEKGRYICNDCLGNHEHVLRSDGYGNGRCVVCGKLFPLHTDQTSDRVQALTKTVTEQMQGIREMREEFEELRRRAESLQRREAYRKYRKYNVQPPPF